MPERLTADDVLRRYANGERDFRNVNLRGVSFAKAVKRAKRDGQVVDLSGADFSGAQIQGTNFAGVKLRGVNFTGAKAGLKTRQAIIQTFLALLLATAFSSSSVGLTTVFIAVFLSTKLEDSYSNSILGDYVIGLVLALFYISVLWIVARQGYTPKAMRSTLIASVNAGILAIVTLAIFKGSNVSAGTLVIAFAGLLSAAVAVMCASVSAVAVIATDITVGLCIFVFISAGVVAAIKANTNTIVVTVAILNAVFLSIFSGYIAWRTLVGDSGFRVPRSLGLAFGSWCGTCFHDADLTDTNFTKAILDNTNFHQANLTRTCFRGAEKLTRARPGDSILQNWDVLHLLINGRAQGRDFTGANLRGAYLEAAELASANFTRADLSEATLKQADLRESNLKEAAAVGTNFTEAKLTGACIEAWNIDHTTQLDQVDCQYVYLLDAGTKGFRERRPPAEDEEFRPGDFEKLYKKTINVVQILLRNGVNQTAFREAFQELMREHPEITYDSIQGVERKGDDALLTLAVPETVDKGKVMQSFLKPYRAKIRQLKAEVQQLKQLRGRDQDKQAELEAKVAELRTDKNRLFDLLDGANQRPIEFHTNFNNENKAMTNSNNPNITTGNSSFVNTGRMDGNTVNLGTISGNVTNVINQLPDQPSSDQPSLKDLLTELQTAIEAEPELSQDDKAEALEQVKTLAEAGQKPQDSGLQKAAKTAMKILRGTTASISETTKLAEAAAKLLPAIAALLTFL